MADEYKLVNVSRLDRSLAYEADRLRAKVGGSSTIPFDFENEKAFGDAVDAIPTGGITPTGTKEITITENGTTTEDVTNYASVQITANVPSSGGLNYVVETKALASATGSITLDRAFENFILLAYLTTPPTSYPANNYAVAHMTAYVDGDFYLPTKTTAVKSQSGTSFQGNCVSPSKFSVSETSINWSPYATNFGVVGDWTFVQIEIADDFGMYSWRKVAEDIAASAS